MAIVSCLIDTNILLRITRRSDPQHKMVDTALARLAEQGSVLYYTQQNIAELWNAMTRPVKRIDLGFGFTAREARFAPEKRRRAAALPDIAAPDFVRVW